MSALAPAAHAKERRGERRLRGNVAPVEPPFAMGSAENTLCVRTSEACGWVTAKRSVSCSSTTFRLIGGWSSVRRRRVRIEAHFKPAPLLASVKKTRRAVNCVFVGTGRPRSWLARAGVKGGVKIDHWGGEKVDHSIGSWVFALFGLRGRLERRPATPFRAARLGRSASRPCKSAPFQPPGG
jgi:hypothetical protein